MNYRHSYHAGNFADVFKHIILVALIKSLIQKDNALCYFDTHAGAGYYDLFSETAQKNKEYEIGIEKLLHQKNPPKLVNQYLNCIQRINNRLSKSIMASLRYYAGSPSIMRYFLRPHDRMTLTELHPQEYQLLKNTFANDQQVNVQLLDGYQGLKSFLPPKERRGLILIDPSYECPHEFVDLAAGLQTALKRFETGVYAVWYPIKNRPSIERFQQFLKEQIHRPMLLAELSIYPEDTATHLNGCGMVIINPPWQIEQQIQEILPWLWKILTINGQGQYQVKWLSIR